MHTPAQTQLLGSSFVGTDLGRSACTITSHCDQCLKNCITSPRKTAPAIFQFSGHISLGKAGPLRMRNPSKINLRNNDNFEIYMIVRLAQPI